MQLFITVFSSHGFDLFIELVHANRGCVLFSCRESLFVSSIHGMAYANLVQVASLITQWESLPITYLHHLQLMPQGGEC